MSQPPMTLATAGHVDHGKTALVHALTGIDTDRLEEEHERGISIVLGYAPLRLPSGRPVSVVDVPGHERYVRTMVAGATGIDAYLMTIAADDGVMPQTREHAAILHGLAVEHGLVAITKADLADPEPARLQAAELLPGVPAVAVSARTGAGLTELLGALDTLAARVPPRAAAGGAPLMHVDRAFTIHGAGTVVTGTLQSGSIGRGDVLRLLPGGDRVRIRGVQVHNEPTERASAGQRVAANLTGVGRDRVARGDALVGTASALEAVTVVDVELDDPMGLDGKQVQVHHGTREALARARFLDGALHRLRLERPLLAAPGERVIVRWISPPGTAGGGVIVAAYPPGAAPRGRRLRRAETDETGPGPARESTSGGGPRAAPSLPGDGAGSPRLGDEARAVDELLRAAGLTPPPASELDPLALTALRDAGRAVRVGRTAHLHADAVAAAERRLRDLIEADGHVTLPRFRDELGVGRKLAQALLEHFDGEKLTVRRADDTRVLRRSTRP